jgi:hypothetical protein
MTEYRYGSAQSSRQAMHRFLILIFLGLFPLAACANFPDLSVPDDQATDAGFPELVPIDQLLLTAVENTADTQEQQQILIARIAQLRARARAMQVNVIERSTRLGMASALRRHAR